MTAFTQPERLRPAALRPGDTVGIIAPAGPIDARCPGGWLRVAGSQGISAVLSALDSRSRSVFRRAARRGAWMNSTRCLRVLRSRRSSARAADTAATTCCRGIDLELVRANPKIFCGMQRRDHSADVPVRCCGHGDISRADAQYRRAARRRGRGVVDWRR